MRVKVNSYGHLAHYKVEVKCNQIIVFQPDGLHIVEDIKKSQEFSAVAFMKPIAEKLGRDWKTMIAQAASEMGMTGEEFLKLDAIAAEEKKRKAVTYFYENMQYSPVFRFTLNLKLSNYSAERRCYRGNRDWIFLRDGSLAPLINKYIKHLGKDSFYDLM